jgi:glycerate kinase
MLDNLDAPCGVSLSHADYETPLRIALAFDSFKGSLGASLACITVENALITAFEGKVQVKSYPMADGGEGSLSAIGATGDFEDVELICQDALGRPTNAHYLLDRNRQVAHIEIAEACGLPKVADQLLNAVTASSYGAGEIISDALANGAQEIHVYLGGSATSDGGTGMLAALGVRFLNQVGQPISRGALELMSLEKIDTTEMRPDAKNASWVLVSDVNVPLTGEFGAAQLFGPQKGASRDEVEVIEMGLTRLAKVAESLWGVDVLGMEGSGAAGGMGVLLLAGFNAKVVPGARHFASLNGLSSALKYIDIVLTGEGESRWCHFRPGERAVPSSRGSGSCR